MNGQVQPPDKIAADRVLTEAETIRKLIQHEDNVLHTRLQWFSTIQGLLFAAAAVLVKEGVPFSKLPLGICVVGLVVAASTFHATRMATNTMVKLRQWFRNRHPGYDGPPVIGQPADEWPLSFLRPSRALPISVGTVWVAFFVWLLCVSP